MKEGLGAGRTSLIGVAVNGLITERIELLLRLTHERVEPRFHIRQLIAYIIHKHLNRRKEQIRPRRLTRKKEHGPD
jgi:hypothetical protein